MNFAGIATACWVAGATDQLAALGIVVRRAYGAERCARCWVRDVPLQSHHWAPRVTFPFDHDEWPQDFLCSKCHGEWHGRMRGDGYRDPAGDWSPSDAERRARIDTYAGWSDGIRKDAFRDGFQAGLTHHRSATVTYSRRGQLAAAIQ